MSLHLSVQHAFVTTLYTDDGYRLVARDALYYGSILPTFRGERTA